VVIGIIAVLISLLLPALSKVRESGNRVACAANLHQLALATLMYLGDNHQIFPRGGANNHIQWGSVSSSSATSGTAGDDNSGDDMINLLTHYLGYKNISPPVYTNATDYSIPDLAQSTLRFKVLQCPSSTMLQPGGELSYVFYTFSADRPQGTNGIGGLMPSNFVKAARLMGATSLNPAMWADQAYWGYGPSGVLGQIAGATNHWDKRHGTAAGSNVASLDGSVRWFPYLNLAPGAQIYGAQVAESITTNDFPGNNSRLIPGNAIFLCLGPNGTYPLGSAPGNTDFCVIGFSWDSPGNQGNTNAIK